MADLRIAEYGVAYVLDFALVALNGVDLAIAAADGGTDCTIRKDQGADATATNDFVDRGLSQSLSVSATEMQAKEIIVHVVDTSAPKVYMDYVCVIQTVNNASAQIPYLLADALRISGDATAADNLETAFDDTAGAVPWMGIVDQGTLQSGSGTAAVLRAAAAFADSELVGAVIVITSGTGVSQRRVIEANTGATDTLVVDPAWTTNPGAAGYKIYAVAPAPTTALPDVNVKTVNGNSQTAADIGAQLATIAAQASNIQTRIPAALVSGRIDASVGSYPGNTAQTGDAFGRLGAPVGASTSADIASVQADTDNIQTRIPAALSSAGNIKADIKEVNDTTVQGVGTSGNPWRP